MATASEELTAKLCGKTFLRMWSYPRVFRDQGRTGDGADGKELCDLLVVCGRDMIVFSVKECRYKDTGRPAVDWPRWYDRAIRRSAKQIAGAERWLRNFPKLVYVDKACKTPLPFELPTGEGVRVHRVVVALGSREACAKYRGGNAALRIFPSLEGDEHTNADVAPLIAFAVGNVAPDTGFVHVLDDVSLEIVLSELDTITDFTEYLRKKEALIAAGQLAYAGSEADLLAVYSTHMNDKEEKDIPVGDTPGDMVAAEDGAWQKFRGSQGWKRRKDANKLSYLWDYLIERFSEHALRGTLVGDSPDLADIEQGVRAMAMERRVNRRALSNALGNLVANAPEDQIKRRFMLLKTNQETGYVFVTAPVMEPEDKYRPCRRLHLSDCCLVFAWKNQQLRRVIGIATEPGARRESHSEDLVVFDVPDVWPADLEAEVREISLDFGILSTGQADVIYKPDNEFLNKVEMDVSTSAWLSKVTEIMRKKHPDTPPALAKPKA